MISYECSRCGYETTERQKYDRHTDRETPCSDKYAKLLETYTQALQQIHTSLRAIGKDLRGLSVAPSVAHSVPAPSEAPVSDIVTHVETAPLALPLATPEMPAAGLTTVGGWDSYRRSRKPTRAGEPSCPTRSS